MMSQRCYPGNRMARKAGSIFCFHLLILYPFKKVFLFTNPSWDLYLWSSTRASWNSNCIRKRAREREILEESWEKQRGNRNYKRLPWVKSPKKFNWKVKDTNWRQKRIWLKGVEKWSHLHQVVPSLAADNKIVLKSIHRLQVSDDGKLIPWDRLWAPYFCQRVGHIKLGLANSVSRL